MKTINGTLLLKCLRYAFGNIANHSVELNKLNVFPVPDGDTGYNMSRAMSGITGVKESESASTVLCNATDSILRNSRGNSGTILAVFFLGLYEKLSDKEELDSNDIIEGFINGYKTSYKSVEKPKEGTILTVIADCVKGGVKDSIEETLISMKLEAYESVQRTPSLLPILKKNHVVDSGGLGFYYFIEGMQKAVAGEEEILLKEVASFDESMGDDIHDDEDEGYNFCVEGIIKKSNSYFGMNKADKLQQALTKQGGSIVFIETPSLVKFHIHCDDESGIRETIKPYGEAIDYKVDNLRFEVSERFEHKEYDFIVCTDGEGFNTIYNDFGITNTLTNARFQDVSYDELYKAISLNNSDTIFILPNNKNVIPTCSLILTKTTKHVLVIPTTTQAEGIAVLERFDESATPEENEHNMLEALDNIKSLRIAIAQKEYEDGSIKVNTGNWVLYNKTTIIDGNDNLNNLVPSIGSIANGMNNINIYYGDDISEELANEFYEKLAQFVGRKIDVNLIEGGQKTYALLIVLEKY